MHSFITRLGMTIGLALLFALPGCASRAIEGDALALEPSRAARGAATLTNLLPWAQEAASKASPIKEAGEDGVFVTRYEIVSGADQGKVLVETRRAGPNPLSWIITRQVEGETKPMEERFQTLAQDGSLVLPYSVNFERGVRVEMDPPALTAPERIGAGETLAREMKIRLPLIDNPKKLREKGTATSEITYVDDQRVRIGSKAYDARHLREVFTSRFSAASAVRTIDRWFTEGAGLVAERWHEEVTVLGVVIERTDMAIRALPAGGG